jgi:hypothetical protein
LIFRISCCFPKLFCELGANFAQDVAFPSVGTQEAASGRSYGLDLQDSHKTCLRYYRFLMCDEKLPALYIRTPPSIESGLCGSRNYSQSTSGKMPKDSQGEFVATFTRLQWDEREDLEQAKALLGPVQSVG